MAGSSAMSMPPHHRRKRGRPSFLEIQKNELWLERQGGPQPIHCFDRRNPNSIGGVSIAKGEKASFVGKVKDGLQGPTQLPDKNLLLFVLDRLQKKDTYEAFSEPVDIKELPDYNDVIKCPMDFGTIRKKLKGGEYKNLEQFEDDVFQICSNAVYYNAPGTVYYRQAQAIQELAEKEFKNLREEDSDASETEREQEATSKPRRGRPPSNKSTAEPKAAADSSQETPANAGNTRRLPSLRPNKGWKGQYYKPSAAAADASPIASHGTRDNATILSDELGRTEDYKGSGSNGLAIYGTNPHETDGSSRRSTYYQPQPSSSIFQLPVPTLNNGTMQQQQQQQLVGLHQQQQSYAYAYARSLARFAANLGPAGWDFAARRIEQVLPPGTRFGRGWVGDDAGAALTASSTVTAPPPASNVTQQSVNGFGAAQLQRFLGSSMPPSSF